MNVTLPANPPVSPPPAHPRPFGCFHLLLAVAVAVLLTAVATFFVVKLVLFPAPFKPVQLSAQEEQTLQVKLDRLDFTATPPKPPDAGGALNPEAYSETDADRTLRFTEKELNALLAKNTDLADKLAIDLSPNLISAKLLIPLNEDLPILGGKTLRVKTGASFSYENGKPVLMLRGLSVMGVPLPNAWLGGLKNIDVIQEFGGDAGFWNAFADGIEHLSIEDGRVAIRLKE